MSFNAQFTTFNKKLNSTQRPTSYAHTFSVDLKDNCSIVSPILRIYNTANFNPSQLNYCYIFEFGRYYFVRDWEYSLGEWICHLNTDVLATYKTYIGTLVKYVVRSSYDYDKDIIDTFYPAKELEPSEYIDTNTFGFETDSDEGSYVIGIANSTLDALDIESFGSLQYFYLPNTIMRDLVNDMLQPNSGNPWSTTFTGMTDSLYRSVYDPWQYIKSCKWFPLDLQTDYMSSLGAQKIVRFGNYASNIAAYQISDDTSTWPEIYKSVALPATWYTIDAKYKAKPYGRLFLVCNPWGIIELNSKDFTDSRTVKLKVYPDLVTGDAILKIYKVLSGGSEVFITQTSAKLAVDIPLTATNVDVRGMLSGAGRAIGGLASVAVGTVTGNGYAIGAGAISLAGGALDAAASSAPTISANIGQTTNSIRAMDGNIQLIFRSTEFVDEENSEFGKPLYQTKVLSTIPGYIKCADGECSAVGDFMFEGEREAVGEFLVNGFFYE